MILYPSPRPSPARGEGVFIAIILVSFGNNPEFVEVSRNTNIVFLKARIPVGIKKCVSSLQVSLPGG